MAFLSAKNVFDVTIGDGKIKESRKGVLGAQAAVAAAVPETQAYFDKMRDKLLHAKLQEHEITVKDRSNSVLVSVKLRITFNTQEYKQTLDVLRDGKWEPADPNKHVIDLFKDVETRKMCLGIAEKAFELSGRRDWGYTAKNGNPIPPEDMVIHQVREILKPEISAANNRLVVDVNSLLLREDIQKECRTAYEDVIRDRVHKVLADFSGVGPEALHRFVDELYCKKIHDS